MSSAKSRESKLQRSGEYMLWQWKVMEYVAYILVFLTPLYFVNNHLLFSFSAPKTILMIGLVLSMVILYAWGVIAERKLSFKLTPLHIALKAFLLVLTVSSIFGVDPLNSFFGKWIDGISLILIYALSIFALLIGFLVKKNKSFIVNILLASFISGVCVALISYTGSSLSNLFKDGVSTIGNNSYTGSYLLFNACIGVGLFLYYVARNSQEEVIAVKVVSQKQSIRETVSVHRHLWQKILVALGTLSILLSQVLFNKDIFLGKVGLGEVIHNPILLFGQANAADVGLLVSALVIVIFFLILSSKKLYKVIGVVLLASLLFGISYTGVRLMNPTSHLHKVFVADKGENRFISWSIARASFAENPLLGNGFNNFSYSYQKYFTSDILKEANPEFYFYQPHNVVLEYASNDGVLGLISFLALLAFTIIALFTGCEYDEKKYKYIRVALIGALFGYFIQNLFGFDTPTSYLMLFTLIGLAVGVSSKEWTFEISKERHDMFKFIASLVVIVSLVGMIVFVFLPYAEFRRMGRLVATTESLKDRIALRGGIQDISFFGGVFDSSYLAGKYFDLYKGSANQVNDSNKSLYLEEVQSTVNFLERDMVKQPNDAYSHIILNSLLNMEIYIKGSTDIELWNYSFNDIQKAIALNPQNPETYLQLAQTYILKDDLPNAFTSIRQAIETAPNYKKSYDYARKILVIKSDAKFKKFVDDMAQKWGTGL